MTGDHTSDLRELKFSDTVRTVSAFIRVLRPLYLRNSRSSEAAWRTAAWQGPIYSCGFEPSATAFPTSLSSAYLMFLVDRQIKSLAQVSTVYKADDGESGGNKNCYGRNASSTYIAVS